MRRSITAGRFRLPPCVTPAAIVLCAAVGWSAHAADLLVPSQYSTIQAAIDAASSGDRVLVWPGSYPENLDLGSKAITLESTGGSLVTTLSGASAQPYVTLASTAGQAVVEGFTFSNGQTAAGGTGVHATLASVRIVSCVFSGNRATSGPGAAILATASTVVVEGCEFISNDAEVMTTGAAYGGAIAAIDSSVTVADSAFESNTSHELGGAAVGGRGVGQIEIDGCTFRFNSASTDETFGTSLTFGGGSAILVRDATSLTIRGSVFEQNEVVRGSGTVRTISLVAPVLIENCEFVDNRSSGGGGLSLSIGAPGITVRDTLFLRNDAGIGTGGSGGAVSFSSASGSVPNTFERCEFVDNAASAAGAVLARGLIVMEDCLFQGNRATGAGSVGGGAGALRNQQAADGTRYTRCRFIDNGVLLDAGEAGAVSNYRTRALFEDCLFDANFAISQQGGAVFNESGSTSNPTNPSFVRCTFTNNFVEQVNSSPFVNGGAVSNVDGAGPTFTECVFDGNSAWGEGGHIWNRSFGQVTIDRCVFTGGTAKSGGAIFSRASGSVTIRDSLIAGNTATNPNGGGIYVGDARPITITNCTIVENVNGGVYHEGSTSSPIVNSIVWGNLLRPQLAAGVSGTIPVTYSIVQGGWPGTGNSSADPLFVDAAGGDYRLLPGSPAIDSANNTALPPDATLDLDANARFVNDGSTPDTGVAGGAGGSAIVDRGAFEFQGGGPCIADYNGAGEAGDILDFLDFFDDFSVCEGQAGPCGSFGDADVNGDTTVDILDFLDFLDAFGTGC